MKIQSNDEIQAYLRSHVEEGPGGCWLWTRAVDRGGYGLAWANGGRHRAARLSFMVFVGPVPRGHEIHHTCTNRRCINPAHLEPKKHGENMRLHSALGAWRGEKNSRAKLTEADVQFIRMVGPYVTPKNLADQLGVSERTIFYILAGRTWPHVELPSFPKRTPEEVLEYGRGVIQKVLNLCLEIKAEYQELGVIPPPSLEHTLGLARISLSAGN